MIEKLRFWWRYHIRRRCIFCEAKSKTTAIGVRVCLQCARQVQRGWDGYRDQIIP